MWCIDSLHWQQNVARAKRCICHNVGLLRHMKYFVQCESCPSHFLLSYVKLIFVWCFWSSEMPVICNRVNLLRSYLWLSASGMWNGNRRARITLFVMYCELYLWDVQPKVQDVFNTGSPGKCCVCIYRTWFHMPVIFKRFRIVRRQRFINYCFV